MVSSNTNKRDRRRFSAFTVNIVFLLFSIVGLALIPKLTIKLNPKLISNSLTVNYTWPNAVSGVLEHEVTAKLEGAFSTLQGIEHLISGSSNGYGYIKLEAKKHTNIQTLRFEVLSIIKDVWQNLPEGVTYPEIHTGSEGNEHRQLLLSYVLKGNSETSTLQQYAENNLRTKFISFKGISSVEVYGASPYEWQLIYDKDILNKYGIKPNHLFEALQMAKEAKGAGQGFLNNAGGNSIIVPVIVANPGLDRNDPDWKNIPVKNLQGRIIYLGDLVKLHIVQQQPQSYFRINGLNTVFINIYSEETANQISVADKLSLIEQQISTSLPAGFSLEKMFNSTDYLRKELSKTTRRTLAALVIL